MSSDDYHYFLPPHLIAQSPASPRDSSRLMVIDKHSGEITHHTFRQLPQLLKDTDVLVFNDTKVFPARLHGTKDTGGKVEILLLRKIENSLWEVISHPGIKSGQTLHFPRGLTAAVISPSVINLISSDPGLIAKVGHTPLPPYIHSTARESLLRKQYQTIYAKDEGSAAAPTAGLHFTPRLIRKLLSAGHQLEFLTLHVGLGTFKSPTQDQIASGHLHSEWFTLDQQTAERLNLAKSQGRRIIAVGTTTTRVLETCAVSPGSLAPRSGETDIFIKPPYQFRFVDGLITNFHLPGSSLLMLVSALATPQIVHQAYKQAIAKKYRFFSFGDACLFI